MSIRQCQHGFYKARESRESLGLATCKCCSVPNVLNSKCTFYAFLLLDLLQKKIKIKHASLPRAAYVCIPRMLACFFSKPHLALQSKLLEYVRASAEEGLCTGSATKAAARPAGGSVAPERLQQGRGKADLATNAIGSGWRLLARGSPSVFPGRGATPATATARTFPAGTGQGTLTVSRGLWASTSQPH